MKVKCQCGLSSHLGNKVREYRMGDQQRTYLLCYTCYLKKKRFQPIHDIAEEKRYALYSERIN